LAQWSSEEGEGRGGGRGYKTARGGRQRIMYAGLRLGKGRGKQRWEKREGTETKDNQLVREGITILTVMGTDGLERGRGRGGGSQQINRSKDDRRAANTTHTANMKALTLKDTQIQRYIVDS